jgi:hypothetical protein
MAKELPFFKFEISEWMFGRIQKQPASIQGVFINLCCKYWHKLGELSFEDACLDFGADNIKLLSENKIIGNDKGYLYIKFLDRQLDECELLSKKNSLKGLKSAEIRAARRQLQSTTVEPQLTGVQPNSTEEKRIEKRIEKRRELGNKLPSPTFEDRKKEFYNLLTPEVNKYSKKMMRAFYEYWTEKSPKGKKMRFEMQKVFDVTLRLSTWAKREGIEPPEARKLDYSGAEIDFKAMNKEAWEKIYDYQLSTDQNFRKYFNYAEL